MIDGVKGEVKRMLENNKNMTKVWNVKFIENLVTKSHSFYITNTTANSVTKTNQLF